MKLSELNFDTIETFRNGLNKITFLTKFAQKLSGEVTNAENIKADMPKILRPTHFSRPKDIKANSFLALINIKADMKKVNNNAENVTNIKAENIG